MSGFHFQFWNILISNIYTQTAGRKALPDHRDTHQRVAGEVSSEIGESSPTSFIYIPESKSPHQTWTTLVNASWECVIKGLGL